MAIIRSDYETAKTYNSSTSQVLQVETLLQYAALEIAGFQKATSKQTYAQTHERKCVCLKSTTYIVQLQQLLPIVLISKINYLNLFVRVPTRHLIN